MLPTPEHWAAVLIYCDGLGPDALDDAHRLEWQAGMPWEWIVAPVKALPVDARGGVVVRCNANGEFNGEGRLVARCTVCKKWLRIVEPDGFSKCAHD
jgi:hypothetical protein